MVKPRTPYELTEGRYGPMLANRFDHYIGQALIRYGEYGEHELELMRHFIAEPGTVVEIGANNGSQSVALAQAARAVGGDLVVFEPQPFVFQNLCANLALNALDNVTALPFACGAAAGTVSFERPDYTQVGNFGGISMSHEAGGSRVEVPCVKADDWLTGREVKLLKIDVEGFELEALVGASSTIQASRPVIYLENDRPAQSSVLIDHLWKLDYRLWWHAPPLFNVQNFKGNQENIYPEVVSCNMLCLPRELPVELQGLPEVVDAAWHPFAS